MIVSVTLDLALDNGSTYAGGLGILEGDKFYAMADLGVPYTVFTLYYRRGYVAQRYEATALALEPEEQESAFLQKLYPEQDLTISLNGEAVRVRPLTYCHGTARAVFFEAVTPEWATALTDRIYIERNERERFLKMALLARASFQYIESRFGWYRIQYVDFQESGPALGILAVPPEKAGFVLHTPGPWGHPVFPRDWVVTEFRDWIETGRWRAPLYGTDVIHLTEQALRHARRIFAVSQKHRHISEQTFPFARGRLQAATNGIYLKRWQHPDVAFTVESGDFSAFVAVRERLRRDALYYWGRPADFPGPILLWARRLTRYKRPYFVIRFIERHPDLPALFVLGGRPHPHDEEGIRYAETFLDLARRDPRVILIENYNLSWARRLMAWCDLLLFTPFSGWEACGTSFMKAGVNGVPTLSSRDGGALEMIQAGQNGWFFGEERFELIDIFGDPRWPAMDEADYADFERQLLGIIDLYRKDRAAFYRVSFQAARTFSRTADIRRTLRILYDSLIPEPYGSVPSS